MSGAPDAALSAIAAPAAAAVARFVADVAALWPREGRATLGVAVSGGPDSLALLLLAQAAWPGAVAAATIDHGLRAESAAEAAFVAQICTQLGVPHAVLQVRVAVGNVQAAARAARYAALGQWLRDDGIGALATAHHADDQAETLLMRLNRASGVSGLAGVRARGRLPGAGGGEPDAMLLRPLLGWRRAELAEVVADGGLTALADPANVDPRYDRARLRGAMAGVDWLDVSAIAASAAHLADADAALDWAAAREWEDAVVVDAMGVIYRPRAPRAIALRVLARIVAQLGGETARGGTLAQAFAALCARQAVSIGDLVARPSYEGWRFTRAPARRATSQPASGDPSPADLPRVI